MNVLIVDDEPIIRVGLRTLIEWEKHGFQLVGEASDGEEALTLMAAHPVDLLVTDIRMPRVDGLELIRRAKLTRQDIGIVVLSCLDDFSFVKEAMKLGAKDYILKPTMEPEDLVDVLLAIAGGLQEERRERDRIQELNERLEQSRPYRLEAKLRAYFENGTADAELEAELLGRGSRFYSMLVCTAGQRQAVLGDIGEGTLVVRLQGERYFLLLEWKDSRSTNVWYQKAFAEAERIQRMLAGDSDGVGGNPAVVCVGPPMHELEELPRRLTYHEQQFASRYYGLTAERVLLAPPASELAVSAAGRMNPASDRMSLLRAIAGSNEEAMRYHLHEMLAGLLGAKPELTKLHAFVFETIGLAIGYARENGHADIHEVEQKYLSFEAVSSFLCFNELTRWLEGLVNELIRKRYGSTANMDAQHPFVRKAVAYIRDNYSRNIGTADIAEHVKLSRSYLSDLYSKEMGESLTETLTRVRIEEACKLLGSTDKKIYEVALDVGFNDSKTFTKTFKRLMGCSPKEYPLSNK